MNIKRFIMLKNKLVYYILIFAPLLFLFMLGRDQAISAQAFVIFLCIYIFIYRKFTDIYRLIQINALTKEDSLKYYLPWRVISAKFFKPLYF